MSAKLGEILVRENLISPQHLREALDYQREHGGRLGFNLVKLGLISDDMITAVLSRQYGIPSVNLDLFNIDPAVISLIPQEVAQKHSVLPLSRVGATLTLAMVDPTNVFAMDDVKFMTGLNVEPVVVAEASIQQAISKYYGTSKEIELAPTTDEVVVDAVVAKSANGGITHADALSGEPALRSEQHRPHDVHFRSASLNHRRAAGLLHPGAPRGARGAGAKFISMPLVKGRDLAAILANGPLPVERALRSDKYQIPGLQDR